MRLRAFVTGLAAAVTISTSLLSTASAMVPPPDDGDIPVRCTYLGDGYWLCKEV